MADAKGCEVQTIDLVDNTGDRVRNGNKLMVTVSYRNQSIHKICAVEEVSTCRRSDLTDMIDSGVGGFKVTEVPDPQYGSDCNEHP